LQEDAASFAHIVIPVPEGSDKLTFTLVHTEDLTESMVSCGVNTTHFATFNKTIEWGQDAAVDAAHKRIVLTGEMDLTSFNVSSFL
jgi:hypothetical protein